MLHAIRRREIEQRWAVSHPRRDGVDGEGGGIRQEYGPGLRAQIDDVPGAVVFLVLPRPLVLADDVALVLVDREAPGDARLLVPAHAQLVQVQARRLVKDERRRLA